MNKKRWIAIVSAIILFVASIVATGVMEISKKNASSTNSINELLGGEDSLSENVIEAGKANQRIVLLTIEGTILSGGTSGMFNTASYDHQLFMSELQKIEEDDTIKGIVLSVNSPGGGTYESAQIKDKLVEIKEKTKKPLYVSMKNMAASGGYYVSANAEKIFATDETMTGSIGVIMSGSNYSGLFEKLGISDTTIKSGEFKDIGSASRPMTEEDRAILQQMIDDSYGRFVNVVATGRHMDESRVRELADGRIYDGAQAKAAGLVDEIGYQEDVIKAMRKDYSLKEAELFEYQAASPSLSSLFTSKASQMISPKNSVLSELDGMMSKFGTTNSPKMMYLYGGE
ncbi:signal peptide peptidase SppA [Carnobacterium divergens]|uniref:Signal peptide peptidase SppA n=1 Tax=Carnobacterium divergens DSM 20623 TaxID=1449336 RepID=A0A0R2HMT8_CARDV|nr:signal peptide peptidase SppA [Carnobacterium divergens]KRN54217.1 signal peptide peptidase SppA [Carnobacterium divergens DSM 20623]MDO0873704.1 signal peptide peptidase SppA [Carnobacterium divergens]MDT1995134.1 signal peptide peptidase SppA [Carnobacterium divergens]TFI64133.1 signal peptide peptidase SppA [Carnobacterium divergens]TFI64377.1 signal peptide peptidase SppA [Carnobacterium divergens]